MSGMSGIFRNHWSKVYLVWQVGLIANVKLHFCKIGSLYSICIKHLISIRKLWRAIFMWNFIRNWSCWDSMAQDGNFHVKFHSTFHANMALQSFPIFVQLKGQFGVKNTWKALTGLDRESAHLLQLHAVKRSCCTASNPGTTGRFSPRVGMTTDLWHLVLQLYSSFASRNEAAAGGLIPYPTQ